MNIRGAIEDTMSCAKTQARRRTSIPELSFEHLVDMHEQIKADDTMSDGKLNRWLGWMQAAIVSWGHSTLEDMKQINLKNSK